MSPPSLISAISVGRSSVGEDLLTSLILGHLFPIPGALPTLLRGAAPLSEQVPLLDPTRVTHLQLWPWWDGHPDVKPCEPDAELVFLDGNGQAHLLAVEAKLGAEKSGNSLDDDQLMRQVANGPARARELGVDFAGLLFLTADSSMPVGPLLESTAHIKARGLPPTCLLWTNWSRACELLGGLPRDPVTSDLIHLLRRLGQGAFTGWRSLKPAPWSFSGMRTPLSAPPWRFATTPAPLMHSPPWSFND